MTDQSWKRFATGGFEFSALVMRTYIAGVSGVKGEQRPCDRSELRLQRRLFAG
jgi:hypothetical protein